MLDFLFALLNLAP